MAELGSSKFFNLRNADKSLAARTQKAKTISKPPTCTESPQMKKRVHTAA